MFTLNFRGRLRTTDRPLVMGIINTTPDSFYSGSRQQAERDLLQQAEKYLSEGADILDLGGQSTRPGSVWLQPAEEAARVLPAIERLARAFPEALLSVDTFYATVARDAVNAGAVMVNDISGGLLDPGMLAAVAQCRVPYVCMHMRGTPQTMQQLAGYENITAELVSWFIERLEACRQAGINDVVIDPGFGFAKSVADNFRLLNHLACLRILERPILVGLSRKSTVYRTLDITPEQALNGTTVLHTLALLQGAHLLRVHDAKEARQCIRLMEEYRRHAG